jgi:hypothetical protein
MTSLAQEARRASPSPLRGGWLRRSRSRVGFSNMGSTISAVTPCSTVENPTRPSLRSGHPPRKGEGGAPLVATRR